VPALWPSVLDLFCFGHLVAHHHTHEKTPKRFRLQWLRNGIKNSGLGRILPPFIGTTKVKLRSLVPVADMDALKWVLTRLIAEKLCSADADTTVVDRSSARYEFLATSA